MSLYNKNADKDRNTFNNYNYVKIWDGDGRKQTEIEKSVIMKFFLNGARVWIRLNLKNLSLTCVLLALW